MALRVVQQQLLDAGLRFVSYNQRDSGRSTFFDDQLLDHLGVAMAHIGGMSNTGFQAQAMVLEHPDRVC